MKKRILALLLSVFLLVTAMFAGYAEETESPADPEESAGEEAEPEDEEEEVFEFQELASNGRFSLKYDPDTDFICLTDKKTGQDWYSNPTVPTGSDPYTEGIARTDIRSIMHITYTNTSRVQKEANSYAQSAMKGDVKVQILDNGARFDYEFKEMGVSIPVRFTLTEDGMIAEILFSEIEESGSNFINNINFLQYFGTAGEEDEGYVIVPDGSGALIRFNNLKNKDAMAYSKPFYGKDLATLTENELKTSRQEEITLPVYGMVKNGYGFLAEVISGAEQATLRAESSGNRLVGAYNTVYTNAVYRIFYELPLQGQTDVSDVLYNAEDPVGSASYAVQFHFTESADADYTDLAVLYRDVLTQRGWLTQDSTNDMLYADFYGGVNKQKSFAGILYQSRETLTSFEQAQEILRDMKQNGVDGIAVNYLNYSDDFFTRDPEIGLTPSGSLGGTEGMADLQSYAAGENIPLSVAADFVSLPSSGNGLSAFSDVSDAINIAPIEVYPFLLASNMRDSTKKPSYLLDPQLYAKAGDTLLQSAKDGGYTALYFDDDAMELYSDLAPGGYQRDRAVPEQQAQMEKLKAGGVQLTFSNPNAYLFAYADRMVNIPVTSSRNILFDQDIPFLQTVLRGMKNIAGEAVNITDVSPENYLKHLEYGTDIRYAFIQAKSEVLMETDLTYLYSSEYSAYRDEIAQVYAKFAELQKATSGARIADHTVTGDVAVTTYDNGAKVAVNYGDTAATVDGITVGAMSCVIQ